MIVGDRLEDMDNLTSTSTLIISFGTLTLGTNLVGMVVGHSIFPLVMGNLVAMSGRIRMMEVTTITVNPGEIHSLRFRTFSMM